MNLLYQVKHSSLITISEVQTTAENLRRADTFEDAQYLLSEFDVVPYPRRGKITSFFKRGFNQQQAIQPEHLLSDSTSLILLPILLETSRFAFVISGRDIVGYVHYSDLNKPIAKIPFFTLYQAVERKLWDETYPRITADLIDHLFPDEAKGFIKKQQENIAKNVDLGWNGVFTFPYILRLGRAFGITDVTDRDIRVLKTVRNRVAHSDRNLVSKWEDVLELAEAYRLFHTILGSFME